MGSVSLNAIPTLTLIVSLAVVPVELPTITVLRRAESKGATMCRAILILSTRLCTVRDARAHVCLEWCLSVATSTITFIVVVAVVIYQLLAQVTDVSVGTLSAAAA
jgi:hypothetical protein